MSIRTKIQLALTVTQVPIRHSPQLVPRYQGNTQLLEMAYEETGEACAECWIPLSIQYYQNQQMRLETCHP